MSMAQNQKCTISSETRIFHRHKTALGGIIDGGYILSFEKEKICNGGIKATNFALSDNFQNFPTSTLLHPIIVH